MTDDKNNTPVDKRKIILISVAASVGTLLLAFLIWSAIFSSQFALFKDEDYRVSIKYPGNWKVVKGYQGTLVAFISPKEDELDTFQENLNITVQNVTPSTRTLEQFSQLAIKQMEAVFSTGIEVVESKTITLADMPAYLYSIKTKDPNGNAFKFVWFIKGRQAYTITCAIQLLRYDQYAGKIDEMLHSFAFLSD